MKKLLKINGIFVALGDKVSLFIPTGAEEVGLRLYREGMEIAIFVIVVEPPADPSGVTRSFQLVDGSLPLPTTFVKYIGSLLFGPLKVDAHIIEVSG